MYIQHDQQSCKLNVDILVNIIKADYYFFYNKRNNWIKCMVGYIQYFIRNKYYQKSDKKN